MDNAQKNTILIVDDEKLNLVVLSDILSREYTIYLTQSGRTAIEMAKKYLPDLILLDIVMPDMNGFDVLSVLKNSDETKKITVIIITGLESVEDEEKGLALDAADFIYKPFSDKVVQSRVQNQIQIVNHIRELVILQKDLKAAVNAAEAANIAKSSFLARMSHEIRTPLNAVLGISEIQLQDETISHDIKEAFTRIYSSGKLLMGIINDILDISKIEAGKLELMPSQYLVSNMINDTVFLNMIKYENKPIEFILNVDENIPSELFGDELRIKQILNNLLSIAFKYTSAGEVELSFSADVIGGFVTLIITVRDSGQGMMKEQLDKLFDEYSRFNMEANRTTEGTGLGMSITHNLIQMMNGIIMAESEFGKGSVFTVRLPQGNTGAPALGKEMVETLKHFRTNFDEKKNKPQISRKLIPSGKVLVVDDIDMNLYVAKGMLSPYRLQIDTVLSGAEAIEKIKTTGNTYDIVFMDHMMPIMDGIETTHEIRKWEENKNISEASGGQIPIVALTANAVSGMREMFLSKGFNDFLSKPIDTKELDEILIKWISPEKIIRQDGNEAAEITVSDEADDAFFDEVGKIPEINTEVGLSQLSGNKNTYHNTLEMFYKRLEFECKGMTVSLETKDIKNFTISVHAMKSMLAIIGASELSKNAHELEIASINQDVEFCNQKFPELREKLLSLHKKLSVILSGASCNRCTATKVSRAEKDIQESQPDPQPAGKVLLVDDMDMILYVIKEKLQRYGLQVDTATSGSEAIEKTKNSYTGKEAYNIVFMDHMMPEMDGIEAAQKIRKLGPEYEKLPIIALTANDTADAKEMYLSSGFNGYVSKPVNNQKLEEVLKIWLPDLIKDA